jgi:hypothetical protein
MSDPTRLVDAPGDDATALERELLRAGKEERLGGRDRQEIWAALATQLVPPGSPAGPHAPVAAKAAAAAKAIGAGAALKGTLVAVAIGAGIVGYGALSRRSPPPVAAPRAPVAAPMAPAAAPEPPPAIEPPSRPRVHRPSLAPPPSRLAAEGRVVLEARADLRDGRPDDALGVLEAASVEFADGALVQEREALTIEALARTGRRADAGRRAAAFLRAYPESPHASAVKAVASP